MAGTSENQKIELHITFVAMLFALAIGEIAIDLSKLVNYQLISSQTFLAVAPAYSHLLLAFVIISTSWVGWHNSDFSGTTIKNVFSLDYIELALDLVLVFMYFILARSVEIPNLPEGIFSPNASYETMVVAIIITMYALWDLISSRSDPTKKKLSQRWWASIVCAIISWVLVVLDIGGAGTVSVVIFADISLIALILTFRAMKRKDLCELARRNWYLILFLLALVIISSIASIKL